MATNLIDARITVPNTTASLTLGQHLSDYISVREFGAKGDGSTDDTAAIQAAVNYACTNQRLLLFPQGSPEYKISDQIVIPYDTHNWAIRGAPHRVRIKQVTSNKPFIHFDSLSHSTTGLTNGGFDICNFRVEWASNQAIANTHAAVIEFNDGGWADFVLENLENANGCRCITHQYPGQTVSRPLNVWGCIFRHLYNAYSSSGAAIYLRSNPPEGLPNILIEHVYSVQAAGAEELIHLAGATGVTIKNVEQNFGNFTPGFVGWAGTGNVTIENWRVESFDFADFGSAAGYFSLNGGGGIFAEYKISNFEMRFGSINTVGNKYLFQTTGARVVFDGFYDAGPNWVSGNLNLIQMADGDSFEAGLSTIGNSHIRFVNPADTNLHQINFTGGSSTHEFYKNTLTTSMTNVLNDDPSTIKAQVVASGGWIWSIACLLDATVTAGSITFQIFKNGTLLDSGNFNLVVTTGTTARKFNEWLKNQGHSAYNVVTGDRLDIRITTTGTFAGPANAKIVLKIANI